MEEMFVPSLADAVVLAQWHLQSAMGVSWRRISLPAIARGLQERANAAVGSSACLLYVQNPILPQASQSSLVIVGLIPSPRVIWDGADT